jgi:hypothetical protein
MSGYGPRVKGNSPGRSPSPYTGAISIPESVCRESSVRATVGSYA